MFGAFNKRAPADFGILRADMHAHIVPGVDDGAQTLEESLVLLKALQNMGFTHVFGTPHISPDLYPNSRDNLLPAAARVLEHLQIRDIQLQVGLAAEYYLDEHFEALLHNQALLTLPGNYALFEMSCFFAWPGLTRTLFEMIVKEYRPILAHPERYPYFQGKHFCLLEELHHRGCFFQVNLLSFHGAYGRESRQCAFQLLEAGLIDFLGTDAHNLQSLSDLEAFRRSRPCHRLLDKYEFKNRTLAHV